MRNSLSLSRMLSRHTHSSLPLSRMLSHTDSSLPLNRMHSSRQRLRLRHNRSRLYLLSLVHSQSSRQHLLLSSPKLLKLSAV